MVLVPLRLTQQYCLASMAPQLYFTGISHHSLCPHILLSAVSLQSSPWDCSTIPKLQTAPSRCTFLGTCVAIQGMYGCGKDCLILIPFRLPQIIFFTLSLKCFSSDSDSCSSVGIGHLLQFPHPPRAGPVLVTLQVFPLVPSSYRVLRGSVYSFPLVRYSCPLSAGVAHARLCVRCIPDVSVERDVLHVHLLLLYLVLNS